MPRNSRKRNGSPRVGQVSYAGAGRDRTDPSLEDDEEDFTAAIVSDGAASAACNVPVQLRFASVKQFTKHARLVHRTLNHAAIRAHVLYSSLDDQSSRTHQLALNESVTSREPSTDSTADGREGHSQSGTTKPPVRSRGGVRDTVEWYPQVMELDTRDAAHLVRLARAYADMTQRDLAIAAGVKQPHIASIESGTRPVSSEMLERILAAANYRPTIALVEHLDELKVLGAEFGVSNIRVFGSVRRGDDSIASDLDLLVDYDTEFESPYLFRFGTFIVRAEALLGCRVDVVVDNPDNKRPGMAHIRESAMAI